MVASGRGVMFRDLSKGQMVCLVEHLSLNRVAALCVKPILALPNCLMNRI
jgi:hypothetical protein